MKRVIFALLVSLSLTKTAASQDARVFVKVDDNETGFLMSGNSIIRELPPGIHTKLPFVHNLVIVDNGIALPNRRSFEASLATGEACRFQVVFYYTLEDPRRVLTDFIMRNGKTPSGGKIDWTVQRRLKPDAAEDAEAELISLLAGVPEHAAKDGTLDFIVRDAELSAETKADGTKYHSMRWAETQCQRWERRARTRCSRVEFGEIQPFEGTSWKDDTEKKTITHPVDPIGGSLRHASGLAVRVLFPEATIIGPENSTKETTAVKFMFFQMAAMTPAVRDGSEEAIRTALADTDRVREVADEELAPNLDLVGLDFSKAGFRIGRIVDIPNCTVE